MCTSFPAMPAVRRRDRQNIATCWFVVTGARSGASRESRNFRDASLGTWLFTHPRVVFTFHLMSPQLVRDGPKLTASFHTVTLLHRATTGHLIEIHLNCLAAQKRTRDLFWNHKARRFYCANGCISSGFVVLRFYHSRRCSIPRILQIRNVIV